MALHLEAVVAIRGTGLRRGGLRLADRAARQCLSAGHRVAEDVDVLVNAGLYHDRSLGEPALAAMIQDDIGANRKDPRRGRHGTFSFDVANGGCGVLDALRLLNGFGASGIADMGLVVASDSDPGHSSGFPYEPVGAAALVSPGSRDGFTDFASFTYPEHAASYESRIVWHPTESRLPWGRPGKNLLEVRIAEDFEQRCIDCAETSVRAYLARRGWDVSAIDLWLPSPFPLGFGAGLAARLGLPGPSWVTPEEGLRRAASAGPLAVLDAAVRDGRFLRARTALVVAAGAGITIELGLHQRLLSPV